MKRIAIIFLCISLIGNLVGCGTLLYPERQGQTGGKLDTNIVILNSVGLLVFLLPGIVAFAVDFINGTIYLPGGKSASLTQDELDQISTDGVVNSQNLRKILNRHSENTLILPEGDFQVREVENVAEFRALSSTFMARI